MFEKGSYVIYRSEGVCLIRDIRPESFGTIGAREDYYILSPLRDPKSTVFVPVGNEALVRFMRELMNAEQIMRMAEELKEARLDWINDSRARNNAWKEILARGDRRELVMLCNTLSEKLEQLTANGRKASSTDMGALRRAERMLFEEFSATTDIASSDDVLSLLHGDIGLHDRL